MSKCRHNQVMMCACVSRCDAEARNIFYTEFKNVVELIKRVIELKHTTLTF